jgi:hypothetical protein
VLVIKIIKHKEVVIPYVAPGTYSHWVSPNNRPRLTTQQQLDDYLLSKFPIGSLVTYDNYGGMGNLHVISIIVDIKRDINSVKYSYDGKPETHQLIQLGGIISGNSWDRWDCIERYRSITDAEKEEAKIASIQNHLEEYLSQRKAQT